MYCHTLKLITATSMLDCNILETINKRVGELSDKLISNSSKNDQQMQRLCTKIDRLASTVVVVSFVERKSLAVIR